MAALAEIRILPPFAIARLGSSPDPMDNYDLVAPDPIGYRQIRPAQTLVVDPATGELREKRPPFDVRFRDDQGRIRPVSPFLEVWARLAGSDVLAPLDLKMLDAVGAQVSDIRWRVTVGNIKAFRRTGDPNDKVEADTGPIAGHAPVPLAGRCPNFLADKWIPFGSVQFITPNEAFPQIRLRFVPAGGRVYGSPLGDDQHDGNLADVVYDPAKGHWKGYQDPADPSTDPILGIRRATNPGNVYAGTDFDAFHRRSWGYLDDECDGIVEATIAIGGTQLTAYARIAAGPPTFAPDGKPVRTVHDEIEQALNGPDLDTPATPQEIEEVREIVRRALETVRLMNTGQMNKASRQRGVGMARMDFLDTNRALEPLVDPALADSLAIRSRHERVLLALESGSLPWFARVLREHDTVGDLSDDGRRKMPALMRGADARHLALTRRQVSKVRAAAEYLQRAARSEDKP